KYNSVRTPKLPIGYDVASKPIGIFLWCIFSWQVPWHCPGRRIWLVLLFRQDLRSIRPSPFVASRLTSQATIRRTSLGLSGFVRGCGWPGYRRGDGLGIRARMSDSVTVSRRPVAVFAADVE